MGQPNLTSCLNAKVDLALRWVGDGVSAKLNIRTVNKKEIGQQAFKLSPVFCLKCRAASSCVVTLFPPSIQSL